MDRQNLVTLRRAAYTVESLIHAGVPGHVARSLTVDGPNAVPERALVSVGGRKRTKEPITDYVWGPDAMVLLEENAHKIGRAFGEPEGEES